MTRVVVCVLLAACSGTSKGATGPEAVPVTVAKVQKKTVPLTLRAIGKSSARGVIRWLGKIGDDAFIEAVNIHHWRRVVADWDGTSLILSEPPPA